LLLWLLLSSLLLLLLPFFFSPCLPPNFTSCPSSPRTCQLRLFSPSKPPTSPFRLIFFLSCYIYTLSFPFPLTCFTDGILPMGIKCPYFHHGQPS
jgi:hypothetical protein